MYTKVYNGHVHMHPGLACILWCTMDMYTCTVPTFPPVEFSWTCIDMYSCIHAPYPSLTCLLYNFHGHTFVPHNRRNQKDPRHKDFKTRRIHHYSPNYTQVFVKIIKFDRNSGLQIYCKQFFSTAGALVVITV